MAQARLPLAGCGHGDLNSLNPMSSNLLTVRVTVHKRQRRQLSQHMWRTAPSWHRHPRSLCLKRSSEEEKPWKGRLRPRVPPCDTWTSSSGAGVPGPWTGASPWAVRNQASQQELSGSKQIFICSYSHSLLLAFLPELLHLKSDRWHHYGKLYHYFMI